MNKRCLVSKNVIDKKSKAKTSNYQLS